MVLCMKTTVEIVDPLLAEAKRVAAREGTTVRALIEEGLRRVIEERQARSAFTLRRATFRGNGLTAEVREGSWERIRELVYKGHGA
jgi:hypothetical protein